jgi:biopolymer transport protein ExbD
MNLRPRRRPVPAIPIVSLIDIMVVLLIFFVATTTFRKDKTVMQITLPESKSMGAASPTNAPELRLTIGISKDKQVSLDGKVIPIDALAKALIDQRSSQPNLKFELEADTDSPLGLLIKVWDALKAAGIPITDVPARLQRID